MYLPVNAEIDACMERFVTAVASGRTSREVAAIFELSVASVVK